MFFGVVLDSVFRDREENTIWNQLVGAEDKMCVCGTYL